MLWLVKGLGPGGAERLLVAAASVHDRSEFAFRTAYLLPWKDHLVAELANAGVPSECLGVRDERDVRWAARLRRMLVADPVDVVHAHSPYPAGIARLVVRTLPRRIRPALVYTVHNTWSSFALPTRLLCGVTMPLDAADFAVSREVHETLWPFLRRRTEVVVHGIPVARVAGARAERAAVRAELGLTPDEIVVGTVANFRAQKDYPNLFAAAQRLAERRVPVTIVAVGQGPLEAEMRARLAALDLGDRVRLLGYRDDAVRVMGACDAFTLASNNEGLPVAVMEALALGLPVVATRVGGLGEAITDGREGLLVEPRDPTALADALERVVQDEALRARFAAAARARADAFDVGVGVRHIEARYREVVDR
ncbi:MAG TPA: glycosyltransferase [Acidimicrobiia bacterium]|nr:glycosyltransferase [Acidimicrobiia bacterium]